MDTVWPVGEVGRRPFTIQGERAFGPGVFDIKSRISNVLYSLHAVAHFGFPGKRIVVLCNSDEEIGSP